MLGLPLVALTCLIAGTAGLIDSMVTAQRIATHLLLLALLAALVIMQRDDDANRRALSERWEFDGESIGTALKRGFPQRPLLAVTASGCLPYWSELPAVDSLGLNDAYLAKHPPPSFGHGLLAHELGDAAYLLARRPDLISWCRPKGKVEPCFRYEQDLAQNPEFRSSYVPVRFVGDPPRASESILFVRSSSPQVGIRVLADGSAFIPAYLALPQLKFRTELSAGNQWHIRVGPSDELLLPAPATFGDVEIIGSGTATVGRVQQGNAWFVSIKPQTEVIIYGVRVASSTIGATHPRSPR